MCMEGTNEQIIAKYPDQVNASFGSFYFFNQILILGLQIFL